MGRYDKIKYFDGSALVNPSQIKIYDGSNFIDYGTTENNQKNNFYAFDESEFKEVLIGEITKFIRGQITSDYSERWGTYAGGTTSWVEMSIEAYIKPVTMFSVHNTLNLIKFEKSETITKGIILNLVNGQVQLIMNGNRRAVYNLGLSVPDDGNWHKIFVSITRGPYSTSQFRVSVSIDDGEASVLDRPFNNFSTFQKAGITIGNEYTKFKDKINIKTYNYSASSEIHSTISISDAVVGELLNVSFTDPDSNLISQNVVEQE